MNKRYQNEIIGKTIQVVQSANNSNLTVSGKIVDETKHTIVIGTPRGDKRLFKKHINITLDNISLNGNTLIGRSEERIKQK